MVQLQEAMAQQALIALPFQLPQTVEVAVHLVQEQDSTEVAAVVEEVEVFRVMVGQEARVVLVATVQLLHHMEEVEEVVQALQEVTEAVVSAVQEQPIPLAVRASHTQVEVVRVRPRTVRLHRQEVQVEVVQVLVLLTAQGQLVRPTREVEVEQEATVLREVEVAQEARESLFSDM